MAPYLVQDFDLAAREIGFLTSVYFFTFAAMQRFQQLSDENG